MLITLAILKAKKHCAEANKCFDTFEKDYPDGVQLQELLDQSNDTGQQFFEWLVISFKDDIETTDYSLYSLISKGILVRHIPALIDNIGYDELSEGHKRYIDTMKG